MRSETEILARKLMKKYKIEDYKTKDEILPAFYRCALLKECGVIITREIVEREVKITRDRIERDERDELARLSETITLEAQAVYFAQQFRWLLTKTWAEKHLKSSDDVKYFQGGAKILS